MNGIEEILKEAVAERLKEMGLDPSIVDGSMDLVQSGVYDSMSFIDMITAVEDRSGVQLDLESALADPATFTINGLAALFISSAK